MLIHAHGDSYAHTYRDPILPEAPRRDMDRDPNADYKKPIGYGPEKFYKPGVEHGFEGHTPDHITSDPGKFMTYANQLNEALSGVSGQYSPKGSADKLSMERLASWASTLNGAGNMTDNETTRLEFDAIIHRTPYMTWKYDPIGTNPSKYSLPDRFSIPDATRVWGTLLQKMQRAAKEGVCCGN